MEAQKSVCATRSARPARSAQPARPTRPVCPTCPPHPPDLPNVTQLSHASQAQAAHQTRLGFILGPILGFILGGPCLPTEVSFQGHNFPQLPAAPPPDTVITANSQFPYQVAPSLIASLLGFRLNNHAIILDFHPKDSDVPS